MVSAPLLSAAERDRIEAAIVAAEAQTGAELVVVIARAASAYGDLALEAPALAALLLPAIVLTLLPETAAWTLYLAQVGLFAALALLACLPPVRFALIPAVVKRARARRLARAQFFEQGLHRTRDRTGVLLFVALAEHQVEIIADEGIDAAVAPGTWDQAVADFVLRIRVGDLAGGCVAAITAIGATLARHMPPGADDRNELPDRPVEI